MRDRPDARELLETARQALMEELLPALPADRRYTAHLIAAAMATAARELTAGDAAEAEERAALAKLLGEDGTLVALHRALARAVRAGAYDAGPARAEAWRILAAATRAKLLECNPAYLADEA